MNKHKQINVRKRIRNFNKKRIDQITDSLFGDYLLELLTDTLLALIHYKEFAQYEIDKGQRKSLAKKIKIKSKQYLKLLISDWNTRDPLLKKIKIYFSREP